MSATIPSNKQLDDLLKSTGFDCPESLKGKTFSEAVGAGKWYCYMTKTNPRTGYYFKEEIPDADTPYITKTPGNESTLILFSLRKRHPYIVSVICKDGVLTVSYKDSEDASSTASYKLYRSPNADLDLV